MVKAPEEFIRKRKELGLEGWTTVRPKASIVDELARAWQAEVTRVLSVGVCACREPDCKKPIKTVMFKPGHDAKLLSRYKEQVRAILAES